VPVIVDPIPSITGKRRQ